MVFNKSQLIVKEVAEGRITLFQFLRNPNEQTAAKVLQSGLFPYPGPAAVGADTASAGEPAADGRHNATAIRTADEHLP